MRRKLFFLLENSFPFYAGGIENWVFNIISRLCNDYDITVISEKANSRKDICYYSIPENVRLKPYFSFRQFKWYRRFFDHSYLSLIDYKFRKHSMYLALRDATGKQNTDKLVVISLSTMAAAYAANRLKSKRKDISNICSSRGPHAEIMSKKYPLFRELLLKSELRNMRAADIVLTNGYDTQEYYKKRGIVSIVMKNGVDIVPFLNQRTPPSPYNTSKKVILSVGTLWDIKGISELISAFGIMISRGRNDTDLFFAGKGDPSKYIVFAEQLGIKDRVHFIGHQKDLIPFYRNANVIACLSGGGGFGMAAIEAMASGRPVVAWDSPVYRQFNKDSQTMLLTEEKNIQKLANSLDLVLSHEEDFQLMCANAQSAARDYDWANVISEFKEIINN